MTENPKNIGIVGNNYRIDGINTGPRRSKDKMLMTPKMINNDNPVFVFYIARNME